MDDIPGLCYWRLNTTRFAFTNIVRRGRRRACPSYLAVSGSVPARVISVSTLVVFYTLLPLPRLARLSLRNMITANKRLNGIITLEFKRSIQYCNRIIPEAVLPKRLGQIGKISTGTVFI